NAPLINRETNETEWDKRSQNLDEEIFVQNNIIKIRRSILFYDLQDGKQVITNDRRSYNNLCPAGMTQRDVYSDRALEPQSMLSVTTICGKQQYMSGNIRLIEKLLITLSSGRESEASQRLQRQIERQIIKPENCDIPVQYMEDVMIGPRRIDIFRKAEIKPSEGLSEFMTAKKPRIFEFTEIRRYDSSEISATQTGVYYREQFRRPSLKKSEGKIPEDRSALTLARPTSSSSPLLPSQRFSDGF
ncbi:unnamed protein product, partial [Onchocerca ochengi]|uniref:Vitellogenin domain-containing protein n=1 Tax=Onchocerca ochengi TaxID=42157 RepID=A0A182ES12_ONCOC